MSQWGGAPTALPRFESATALNQISCLLFTILDAALLFRFTHFFRFVSRLLHLRRRKY